MLDDHGGRLREFAYQLPGGIQINEIVERELLALKLPRRGKAMTCRARVTVKRRLLMRVFAVTEIGDFREIQEQMCGQLAFACSSGQFREDRRIISGGVREGCAPSVRAFLKREPRNSHALLPEWFHNRQDPPPPPHLQSSWPPTGSWKARRYRYSQ